MGREPEAEGANAAAGGSPSAVQPLKDAEAAAADAATAASSAHLPLMPPSGSEMD